MTVVVSLDQTPVLTTTQLLREAREWCDTPYRHRALVKGVNGGVDCVGLIVGVARALGVDVPDSTIPKYSPNWAEFNGGELLYNAFVSHPHMIEVPKYDAVAGDVFIMRMYEKGPAKHTGFLTSDGIIHSYSGHEVQEAPLPVAWRKRIAYMFRIANVVDDETLVNPAQLSRE